MSIEISLTSDNFTLYDSTKVQLLSLVNAMENIGYRFDRFYNIFHNPDHKAASIISFYTAVRLHNCYWTRVGDYGWIPDFHFFSMSANKSPFRLTSYQINIFKAHKIVETVHLQKTKQNMLRPVQHLVKWVDEDYYSAAFKDYFKEEVA